MKVHLKVALKLRDFSIISTHETEQNNITKKPSRLEAGLGIIPEASLLQFT